MSNSALFRMKRSVKIGTYSFIMGVILLALLIVANLLAGALPAKITQFDTSGLGMTEISDETGKFVSGMTEDVTVYWICEDGVVDEQFRLLLSRYEEAGKHITVKVVDPLAEPTFTAKYSDTAISDYSIIVESARRFTVLDFADLYYYTNTAFLAAYQAFPQYLPADLTMPMSAAALQSAVSQYGAMVAYMLSAQGVNMTADDISRYTSIHSFCAEAKLTSALDYVTREYIPHGYILTGLGDAAPSETMIELLDTMGLDIQSLDLSTSGGIPADAGCLMLYSPKRDLTPHEASLITTYLNQGGSLMLNTSPEVAESCPNLNSVVATFGLSARKGLVQEGDTSFISGSQYTLVPTVSTQHTATAYVTSGGFKPQLPNCHAIGVAEKLPEGVGVTPLFTTSDKATLVSLDKVTTLTEAGKLQVAVAATKSVAAADGTAKTAELTWFASANAFTDTAAEGSKGGNYYFYAAAMSLMNESFVSPYDDLTPVSLQVESLAVEAGAGWILAGVTVILIPAALLTVGIVIWVKRKRR
ncbi:MAG: Gldg family protein [Clostridia bacterium]|nr:Gldg family protein [Clostridia bacterium]